MGEPPVLAIVTRSGLVESRHRGSVAGLAADGTVALAHGSVDVPVFGRSANKPLQAVGVLRTGAVLDHEAIALAAASHSGSPEQLAIVARMLTAVGLDEGALANTAALPLGEAEARGILRAGGEPSRLAQNCSGKHAAMLAACAANGWPVDGYLDPDHPVQEAITATLADLAGEPITTIGVDGCGAPVHAVSLIGLARAYRRIATAAEDSREARVAYAMRARPDLVGGSGREVTRLMTDVPGLIAKDGAEGVYVAALPDGRAVALKIEDGAGRARVPVLLAALRALGVDVSRGADLEAPPVLGGGRPVGEVRAEVL